jgi:hypothetical protein
MSKKRYYPEEIIGKLREADVLLSQGKKVVDVIKKKVMVPEEGVEPSWEEAKAPRRVNTESGSDPPGEGSRGGRERRFPASTALRKNQFFTPKMAVICAGFAPGCLEARKKTSVIPERMVDDIKPGAVLLLPDDLRGS